MVDELKKALSKAESLSENQQRALAEIILREIEWEQTIEYSESKLSMLANEARTEYNKNKTKPFDL